MGFIIVTSPTMGSEAAEHVRWETLPVKQKMKWSSQVDSEQIEILLFWKKNRTFADRAYFFFQSVQREKQDKEQDNGNSQRSSQAVRQDRDFGGIS